MSKAQEYLIRIGINPRYLVEGNEPINIGNLLTDFAQQTNKEAIDTFQEYTEVAGEVIKQYEDCLTALVGYITDVAKPSEDMRLIYNRIRDTQRYIETMQSPSIPDVTKVAPLLDGLRKQDAINEVNAQKELS